MSFPSHATPKIVSIKRLDTKNLINGNPRASRARGLLYLYLILISLVPVQFASAQTDVATLSEEATDDSNSDRLEASLVTAWPGAEIYELCGHEAIRIKGPGFDKVWNFGIFDFNEPNFVYRFVKGETDYMVEGYPFRYFLPEYVKAGRRVEEQVLNLTPAEVKRLQAILDEYTRPPLNRYRYNYIKDNCSTKIADILDTVSGGKIIYTDEVLYPTYRDAMRHYHKNYPWYQFGIDVALGSGLEEELSQKEELFVPLDFYRHAAKAYLPDGRPLVKETRVLNEGTPAAVDGPTPFLLTPLWFSIVVLAFTLILLAYCWRKNCIPKIWYAVFFGAEGLAGCLVAFLVFISEHAATSPNLLIFWLNPLQLLVPLCLWWKAMKYPLNGLMWLNVAAMAMLLVLMPVYDKGQVGQTSFILLMVTDLILAAFYLRRSGLKEGKHYKGGKYEVKKTKRQKNVGRKKK